jgi:hypothetical protein
VVADDIAPFPWFRWEESFEFDVDWAARRVTVVPLRREMHEPLIVERAHLLGGLPASA